MNLRAAIALSTVLLAGPMVHAAVAQDSTPPAPSPAWRDISLSAYAMLGLHRFSAAETFDAATGSAAGSIFGGGARVALPLGGLFVNVGAWQFRGSGERVFVFQGQRFPLGIALDTTITPLEISAGWQFRRHPTSRFRPYVSGGLTSLFYKEVSEFATDEEDISDSFRGYHVAGGAEFVVERWIGIAWELNWSSVADAIGSGGVSAVFDEDDLGGASLRLKIIVGR